MIYSPSIGKADGVTIEQRAALGGSVMHSVTEKTAQAYVRHWADWYQFALSTGGIQDPFMVGWTDSDKAALVRLMLQKTHQDGLRGKQATAVTAGI